MENNELSAQCEARAKEWLSPAFDEETRKEVQAMLDNADKTDLIDVTRQQDFAGRVRIQRADDIACIVGDDLIAVGRHFLNDLFLQSDLASGNGHTVEEGIEEVFVHDLFLLCNRRWIWRANRIIGGKSTLRRAFCRLLPDFIIPPQGINSIAETLKERGGRTLPATARAFLFNRRLSLSENAVIEFRSCFRYDTLAGRKG